jgi:hypothetical protein
LGLRLGICTSSTLRIWAFLASWSIGGAGLSLFVQSNPEVTSQDFSRILPVYPHFGNIGEGVYWKPLYNLLEGEFTVLLVNAKHIKFVPGRKTDVKDAQWIAELLQHGLLKASFIPPAPQRELRELVRYRTHLIEERSREINRVHKLLVE